MPAVYRYEIAKQGRAGCQNSACKNAGVKIAKGEFRFGTLVELPDFGASWRWKHWGCVTPKQISNILDQLGGLDGLDVNTDLDILDGYDELPDWAQEKVKDALVNGHVDDEDWKGDPELNRPGQKGINKRTPKKKADQDEDSASEPDETPVKGKKGGKKKKTQAASDDEDESPVPKKKTTSKKRKSTDDAEDDVQAPPPKKRAAKGKKAVVKDESEEETTAKPVKKSSARSRKATIKDIDSEDESASKPAQKRSSRSKRTAAAEESTETATATEPSKQKGRGKNVKQETETEAEFEAEMHEEATIPQTDGAKESKSGQVRTKSASRKPTKRAAQAEDSNDKEDDAAGKKPGPTRTARSKKQKTEPSSDKVAHEPTASKTTKSRKGDKIKLATDDETVNVEAQEGESAKKGKKTRSSKKV